MPPKAALLKLEGTYKPPGDLVTTKFWLSWSGVGLRVCISNKLLGHLQTTLSNQVLSTLQFKILGGYAVSHPTNATVSQLVSSLFSWPLPSKAINTLSSLTHLSWEEKKKNKSLSYLKSFSGFPLLDLPPNSLTWFKGPHILWLFNYLSRTPPTHPSSLCTLQTLAALNLLHFPYDPGLVSLAWFSNLEQGYSPLAPNKLKHHFSHTS